MHASCQALFLTGLDGTTTGGNDRSSSVNLSMHEWQMICVDVGNPLTMHVSRICSPWRGLGTSLGKSTLRRRAEEFGICSLSFRITGPKS